MTPQEAITGIRGLIETQGPDTSNRHYGRKQFTWLMECCDTIEAALAGEVEEEDGDDVDVETLDLTGLLQLVAEEYLEDLDDMDVVSQAWLTADDIQNRLRAVLVENKYWWAP